MNKYGVLRSLQPTDAICSGFIVVAGFDAAEGKDFAQFVPHGILLVALTIETTDWALAIVVQKLSFTLEHHSRMRWHLILSAF